MNEALIDQSIFILVCIIVMRCELTAKRDASLQFTCLPRRCRKLVDVYSAKLSANIHQARSQTGRNVPRLLKVTEVSIYSALFCRLERHIYWAVNCFGLVSQTPDKEMQRIEPADGGERCASVSWSPKGLPKFKLIAVRNRRSFKSGLNRLSSPCPRNIAALLTFSTMQRHDFSS